MTKESEVTAAYDRWVAATQQVGLEHGVINDKWQSYLAIRDAAGVCGYEDPFGGPCIKPKPHGGPHDDGRKAER